MISRSVPAAFALLLAFASQPAEAGQHWGDFKDNGCASSDIAPGLRSYSAVLWGIPFGASWENACAAMPATFGSTTLAHPAVCVNVSKVIEFWMFSVEVVNSVMDTAMGTSSVVVGALSYVIADPVAGQHWFDSAIASYNKVDDPWVQAGVEPTLRQIQQGKLNNWPYPSGGTPLPGAVPPGQANSWKAKVAALVEAKPAIQVKQFDGGLSMWGVFLVPDETCLPPAWYRESNLNWEQASNYCLARGTKLCTVEQICHDGQPVVGSPAGDVWAATSDSSNSWVSVGAALPERLCKDHTQVAGGKPAWGTQKGPEPVTGEPTAFRCCP
jgi:hypothetical protein